MIDIYIQQIGLILEHSVFLTVLYETQMVEDNTGWFLDVPRCSQMFPNVPGLANGDNFSGFFFRHPSPSSSGSASISGNFLLRHTNVKNILNKKCTI